MSALDHLAETSKNLLHRRGRPHMGTTLSLFPYDAAARYALQWARVRQPAILRYVSWAAILADRALSAGPHRK
jgi:hypothetical protein